MTQRPSVLVPTRVLAGEGIPEGVPELLANAHVVLLGYHVVPDQTAPGQARLQFEERANRKLTQFQERFEAAGATVERRLVFTHDGQTTIDRTISEHDCGAVLVPNATVPPERVLVPVRGAVDADRLAETVAGLFAETDVAVTLYHVTDDDESEEGVTRLLDETSELLVDAGMDPAAIERRVEHDDDPLDAIADASEAFDAVVMGESDPSLRTFIFGMPSDQVAERFLGPVIVVQREPSDHDGT